MTAAVVAERLARWAAQRPSAPAVVHESGTLTYARLAALVAGARRYYRSLGHGPADRLGLLVGNDPQSVIALLALAATGAEVVVYDHRGTGHERAGVDRLAGTTAVLEPLSLDQARTAADAGGQGGGGADAGGPGGGPHAVSLGLVTSGTGGLPKVVRKDWAVTFANSGAFARAARLTADDRILCTTPLHHAFAFGAALLPALDTGAALVLAPHPPAPSALAAALTDSGATVVQSVPFVYRSLLACGAPLSTGGPRVCVSAGEPLDRETADAWRQATGRNLRDQYGATELGQIAFADDRPDGDLRLVDGVRARVLGEHGALLDHPGAEGELCFRLPGPPVAYWGLPELTASSEVRGWFRTGDIGRLPGDGTVVVHGRAGRRITVAGRKVDPAEVEQAVNSAPGVLECMVSAPPAGTPGAGESFVAFVAARPGVTEIELRRHLARLLSPYKVPTRFHLIGRLPRTGSGKVHAARLWQEVARP